MARSKLAAWSVFTRSHSGSQVLLALGWIEQRLAERNDVSHHGEVPTPRPKPEVLSAG
eukprot:CAMPEP_0170505944 /NCGR_PEP_ID=MMETSP0208-20121228/52940_1 /TAXON_ID=197538 /ORGANISM="Strombidium inclinatum, Strain S3" /LENGTH=57 /DNA_ID=CAMNT_0010787141 /DNA_START=559 /DNA_END=732 /DNA_ORIENTATION=-